MAQILPFPHTAAPSQEPASRVPPPPEKAREMIAAAMTSWMQGDPLTAREQRLVDTVIDTNYYGQLGRLAFGG